MRNLSDEQREQLSADIGSDTGFAAAIMNAAKPSEEKPAGVATLPSSNRMPVTASNTTGQSYKRTAGATKEDIDNAELLTGVDFGGPGSSPATLTPPKPEPTKEDAPKEGGIRELLNKYRSDIGKQREIDNYMSLLSAGLGMMGGTSQYGLANVGQGALQGVRTYQQAAQQRSADERALLSGELGLKKYEDLSAIRKAGIERQKAADEANLQLRRDRLVQNQQKMYAEQLQDMIETAQREALARYKGELIGDKKDQLLAQAKTELTQSPEYRQLYRAVYGRDPYGGKGWDIKELGSKK